MESSEGITGGSGGSSDTVESSSDIAGGSGDTMVRSEEIHVRPVTSFRDTGDESLNQLENDIVAWGLESLVVGVMESPFGPDWSLMDGSLPSR